MENIKLIGIKEIKGTIILKTGLHIGAADTGMRIGGTDNTIIKHPHTFEPYIPGSSIKGKIRSLLELESGLMNMTDGEPLSLNHLKDKEKRMRPDEKTKAMKILKLFGASAAEDEESEELGPTRVSFRDCPLDNDWRKMAEENRYQLTEIKPENTINRVNSRANPRTMERVPEGAKFEFNVTIRKFENEEDLEEYLLYGLKLLQMDSLGGSGSRGYGRIEFEFKDEEISNKFKKINQSK